MEFRGALLVRSFWVLDLGSSLCIVGDGISHVLFRHFHWKKQEIPGCRQTKVGTELRIKSQGGKAIGHDLVHDGGFMIVGNEAKQVDFVVNHDLVHRTRHHETTLERRGCGGNNGLNVPGQGHGNHFGNPRQGNGNPLVIVVRNDPLQ